MHYEYLNEVWKDIKGYEGLYQVSNYGRVKSLNFNHSNKEKIMKSRILSGYCRIGLVKNRKQKGYFVHRLVAEAFIPNPHNYPQVNHKDENKLNNFVFVNEDGTVDLDKSNLEWCTQKYNANYGTSINRRVLKQINGKNSKSVLQYDLNDNFIKEWPSIREIQRSLGFARQNILSCCKGRTKTSYGYIWKYKRDVE